MNDKHHWGWIFVALCVLGLVTYIFTINRPDNENFGKGAFKVEQNKNEYGFISFHIGEGGCARLSKMQDAVGAHPDKPPKR